jgi:hypothetical protein
MTEIKLSKAQLELLKQLPTNSVSWYRPAIFLVENGLAEWSGAGSRLLITSAGQAKLDAMKSKKTNGSV